MPDPLSHCPLVLVAGLAGSGAWWRRVRPHLEAAGRAPVTVDLPGFGALAGRGRLLPIPEQAEWLAAQLAAGPVDLVGYSLGGAVAVRVAADHPERVRRLVLVNPGGIPAGRSELADALTALRMSFGAGPGCYGLRYRGSGRCSGPGRNRIPVTRPSTLACGADAGEDSRASQ